MWGRMTVINKCSFTINMKTVAKPAWLDAGTGISLLSAQKWGTIPSLYAVIALHLRVEKSSLFKKLENFQHFYQK